MGKLTGEQVAALRNAYGHLINYDGDDPTAPIDPLAYRAADGDRLIHIAAFAGDNRAVEWLLDGDEDINATGDMDQTAAHYAATNSHQDAFSLLMLRGADPTIVDEFGHTPTMTWELFATTQGASARNVYLPLLADPHRNSIAMSERGSSRGFSRGINRGSD